MLGSAPTDRGQAVRGIESSHIRLGVVQPGENVADFNDALNTLQGSLAYLYTNPSGDRYWYDTRINRDVQRLAEEVISHLTNVDGSRVEVCLEVNVDAPEGMPQTTVRTVSENCQTLKVKDFGVDD